jgi:nucleoside-diphosphate kinase
MSRTLAIIKPDAVSSGYSGEIIAKLQDEGFRVLGLRMTRLTREQAEAFYGVHAERPFFADLVEFMISGAVIPIALEHPDAVAAFRQVIGATAPAEAADGTIRKLYAQSKGRNAIHGSDSDENAATEIAFFFNEAELVANSAHY